MALTPLWKTAKTTFENTTKPKRPSNTWVGNIKKSSGIEGSLKEIDSAKTAADLKKALLKLSTNATAYLNLLDTTAKDPKSVPAEHKASYLTAIAKLKTDLEHIKAEGEKLETALEGTEKKDKVKPEALKAANDFIAQREKAAGEAPKMAKALKVFLEQITVAAVGAAKQLDAAKQAGKASNIVLHQVAIGVIHKHLEQAEQIEVKAKKQYEEDIDEDNVLMVCRMEMDFDHLPESIRSSMKQKRDAPWKIVTQATSQMNQTIGQIEAKLAEIKNSLSLAEAAGNQLKDPKVYVSELNKLKEELEKVIGDASIMSNKIVKANDAAAGIVQHPPEMQSNWYRNQLGQWERYEPEIKIAVQKVKLLASRTALPKGALETPAVKQLVI